MPAMLQPLQSVEPVFDDFNFIMKMTFDELLKDNPLEKN
jgi:hypothetical protein